MSKVLQSPSKRWPGTITISDPLTMPQYLAWLDCNERAAGESIHRKPGAFLPGVLACVEKWELGGGFPTSPTPDTFPASPAVAVVRLMSLLVGEIWGIVNAEDEPPNG